jgi:collagenase-like PrtC family protease
LIFLVAEPAERNAADLIVVGAVIVRRRADAGAIMAFERPVPAVPASVSTTSTSVNWASAEPAPSRIAAKQQ